MIVSVSHTSWQSTFDGLRDLHGVPAAQANAITLTQVRGRWQEVLVAQLSEYDLLFTLPGSDAPFASSVRVRAAHGRHTLLRYHLGLLVEEESAGNDDIDRTLDAFLSRLISPALVCRRCGRLVTVRSDQFEVFEGMHYSCFHYAFEHDPFDIDEECTAGGCPSAGIEPGQHREEPRDSLVEELIDDLMGSELSTRSTQVRIQRRGPGMVAASFDEHNYLLTVRTEPRQR